MNKLDYVKQYNKTGFIRYKWLSLKIKLLMGSVVLLYAVTLGYFFLQYPGGFRIDMLSVGQGDGIFIQSKENVTFFVDGGSTTESDVGKYTIEPYLTACGVRRIDYWFITHLDDDHINGFMYMLNRNLKIGVVCVSKSIEKNEKFTIIEDLCKLRGIDLLYLTPKESIKTKSMEIDVLYPDYPSKEEGANENSLIFLLKYGDFEAVFTGDTGSEQEKALLKKPEFLNLIKDKDIELLKVAHHGSKNSSCGEFVCAVKPKVAIISAGKGNRYGHPTREVLDTLSEAGVETYCTIDSGRIRVLYNKGKLEVMEFNE